MPYISIVSPCFNEEENIRPFYQKVKEVVESLGNYTYEHIFIDNCSTDNTISILKKIAEKDKNVKLILNSRNFGPIRSPFYGLLHASGEGAVCLAVDFQDPPELIIDFVQRWEQGVEIILGIVNKSKENPIMFMIRKLFYIIIEKFSYTKHIRNFNGYGFYDRKIINILKSLNEPYPYFRGLISEMGFEIATVQYVKPNRNKGKTKTNFFTLYEMAMLGFVNHSKAPLRIATFLGFSGAVLSFLVAFGYLIYKLINWPYFQLGMAPVVIGIYFSFSVLLFFLGIIGEYILTIFIQVKNKPLVIEKERINFEQ